MLASHQDQKTYYEKCERVLSQTAGILYKNYRNHMSNKKKLLGELVMPLIISAIYAVCQVNKSSSSGNIIVVVVMTMLLKIYIGLIGISAVRELVTVFIMERTEQYRQYQFIFGLSHQTHTLANLFYMGLYLSATILPFYLTLNYFHFDLVYIFEFGSFVISTCTLALALTAFFKDHKIALEIIGMVFSMSSFLVFFYDENAKETGFVQALAMIMPNSSFTIAILYNNPTASFYSLFCVKFYFLIYSIFEFPDFFSEKICLCCRKISQYVPIFQRQQTNLMEEFELNEVVNSDIEHNSMFHPQKKVVIKTEALIKTYQINNTSINALNGVNLKINKSQIFGLLGRNGAGKTTLVDILTKITKPTTGTFQIVNESQSIGICYQNQILYEVLTVQEHLYAYSLIKPLHFDTSQDRKKHIDEIITMLNIDGERGKRVKQLSGGNKRKLSIAIAIIGKPEILIFDEPTSGLDPLSRIHVWEIFQNLRSMQSTIILTTHHLDEAEKLADWICVIEKGAIIVENTSENIKQKYGKGYHLTITSKVEEGQLKYADVEKIKSLVEQYKLKSGELQHLKDELNFLVKPSDKSMSSQYFEEQFIKIIAELQKEKNFEFSFHSNTLEQSFIAILKDSDDNSGDSLGEQIRVTRQDNYGDSYGCCLRVVFQLWGVYLKNIYFHKSIFLQSFIIYNINILIIVIATFFNKFVSEYINTNVASSGGPAPNPNNNAINIMQGYLIMATAFIHSPVYEKQKQIRGVLNTRGLPLWIYWVGNFMFDFTVFNVNLLLLAKFFAAEAVAELGWLNIFELGIGVILFTYCCSFLFEKVKTASTWFSLINIIFGMVIVPLIIFGQSTFLHYFSFFRYFYPFYDLSIKVFFQENNPSYSQLTQIMNISKPDESTIFANISLYLVILICLEARVVERIRNAFREFPGEQTIDQSIKLVNISKKYGQIEALKDVSYQANEERLALLGHNGAGKSTTFGLISAQIYQDQGYLYVEKKIHKSYQKTLGSTGICYQEDSLWEGVIVKEILAIFSFIVPIKGSDNEIKWLFESLEYDSNNNYKRFKNLSGGNKRKLCMMIALYGDPSIRLLDECSTGLDPSSRLAMVDTIKASKRGTTVFTTHSMSEAERLCLKTVIMSKGKVLQFDYISKLRGKYFNCFWIEIKVKEGEQEEHLKEIIKNQILIEGVKQALDEKGSLKVQLTKQQVKISEILSKVQRLKQKGVIQSYSVIEPKLEDVYIKVTRQDGQDLPVENQSEQAERVVVNDQYIRSN